MADAFNKVLDRKITLDTFKSRLIKHLKTENYEHLSLTWVGVKTFGNIPVHTRSSDIKTQKLQNLLLKSVCPIVEILHSILSNSSKPYQMLIKNFKKRISTPMHPLGSTEAMKSCFSKGATLITRNLSDEIVW